MAGSKKKVTAVLVGCGGISNAWLSSPTVQKKVNVIGYVDICEAAAVAKRDKYGPADAIVGTELAPVLRACNPDVVFDCTIPEAHCEGTLTALRHGCHVLGEKPMADTMPRARRMVAAAEKAGSVYAVMQNRRYTPPIRSLRRFLDSGALGRVHTVHSDFFLGVHFGGFRDEMKHVLLLDMAIHTFDAARLITGANANHVYCHEWNPVSSWYAHGASANAVFEMSNDIVYTYSGSWCAEGLGTSWECGWRIIGEKGTLIWDGNEGFKCELVSKREGFFRPVKERKVPVKSSKRFARGHDGCIAEFIDALEAGRAPETVCTDNVNSMAMVHAAVRSAETGRRVKVVA